MGVRAREKPALTGAFILVVALAVLLWTAAAGGSLVYHIVDSKKHIEHIARETAAENIRKDMLYRIWASTHGGVYVPVTESTYPNPLLSHLKERDITTPSGRRLTLMDPASMMRQVYELARDRGEVLGHITSLDPLRPENGPDDWEKRALNALAGGQEEFGEIVSLKSAPHYRLMLPLFVEKPCLTCHELKGYRLGDFRGGISASIPMEDFELVRSSHIGSEIRHFASIWALGIIGITIVSPYIRRRIAERERAVEALRESESRYRALFEHAGDYVLMLEIGKNGVPVIADMNEAAPRAHGYTREEMLGQPISLIDPDHSQETIAERASIIQSDGLKLISARHRRKDGTLFDAEVWTRRVRMNSKWIILSIERDVTERKRVEGALLENEKRYRELFDGINNCVAVYEAVEEGRDFIIKDFNRAAERLERVRREAILGRKVTAVFPGVGDFGLLDVFRRVWRTGMSEHHPLSWYKDGRITGWRENYVYRLPSGEVVAIYEDVTRLKLDEEERKLLQEQLVQAQKMESVGRLAGGVAHDINNMLMPILGYAEMLIQKLHAGDSRREEAEAIIRSAERVRDVTRQLLAFARKQTMEMRPLDLNKVVEGFENMLRRTMRENVTVEARYSDNLPVIMGDAGQIEQVILNLAINAQDAMPDDGTLVIETSEAVMDEAFVHAHKGAVRGEYVTLSLRDTGVGMDKETMSRVFEPFFTTKEVGRGTGLGLSMVYGIVKQHGGYIEVSSEQCKGSVFQIYFPVAGNGQIKEPVDELEAVKRGTETLLIVEDQKEVLDITAKILDQCGYRVLRAADVGTAVSVAEVHPGLIDLLITDVVMPGMNGKDLFENLRRIQSKMKVLYMSGYPADVISTHGVLHSGTNFIRKPFSISALASKVRTVLDG